MSADVKIEFNRSISARTFSASRNFEIFCDFDSWTSFTIFQSVWRFNDKAVMNCGYREDAYGHEDDGIREVERN